MATDPDNNRYVFDFELFEDGWNTNMDSTMDRLDRDVPNEGMITDRRDPTGEQVSNWFYAEENRVMYRNTGTSWEQRTDTHVRNALAFIDRMSTGGEAIQAAVDDLPDEGGTVVIPANGPEEDDGGDAIWELDGQVQLRSNVRLRGDDARLFLADGSDSNMIVTNVSEGDSTVSDVLIEGLHFDGNRANNGDWERPDGLFVNASCVLALESERVFVRRCSFTSCDGYGVKFALSSHGVVDGCYATDMGDDAFTVTDTRYTTSESEHNTFVNCRAEDNDDAGFEVDDGPRHTKFVNCVSINNVEGFDAHTHDFADTPASWQDVYYVNCTAIDNEYGWKLGANNHDDQARGVYCSNIYVEGSSIAAFSAGNSGNTDDSVPEDVTVDGFVFHHPASASTAAIDLRSPNGVSGWTFSDGTVRTGRRGLNGDFAVEKLQLQNVEFDCSEMIVDESGVELNAGSNDFARNIEIIDCSVYGAQNSGLQMWTGGGDLSQVTISGGSYRNNGQGGSDGDAGRAGISINDNGGSPTEFSVSGVRATDNQATKTQQIGIWWDGVVDSAFVGNVLTGNASAGAGGTLGSGSTETANIT